MGSNAFLGVRSEPCWIPKWIGNRLTSAYPVELNNLDLPSGYGLSQGLRGTNSRPCLVVPECLRSRHPPLFFETRDPVFGTDNRKVWDFPTSFLSRVVQCSRAEERRTTTQRAMGYQELNFPSLDISPHPPSRRTSAVTSLPFFFLPIPSSSRLSRPTARPSSSKPPGPY